MFLMLCLYRLRLLRATPKFVKGVMAAMFGIVVVYVINLITTLFFQSPLPILHDSTPLGIGISIIICGVAALSFIIDFDMIEQNAGHAPKFMEWYAAFGILVTLVWLYIEMLNLLRKFRN